MAVGAGYRRSDGASVGGMRRLWPLVRQEFGRLFRSRWGVGVFAVCLLPIAVRLFVLMVWFGVINFGGMRSGLLARSESFARWNPMRPDFYVEAVVQTFPGLPLFVLLTATVMTGAVARDRMTNALELLWTRGITPFGYLAAKWFGSFLLLALVMVAAPLVLWIFAVSFAEDWSVWERGLSFMPQLLAGLTAATALWSLQCVLVSCLASSTGQATVSWCILMLGSSAVANVMAIVFRDRSMKSWLSLWDAGGIIARGAAGVSTRGAPAGPAWLVELSACFVLALLVRRRLRVTEAMG